MIAVLSLSTAFAVSYTDQEVCVGMDSQFEDTMPNADYWTTREDRPFRGMKIVFQGPGTLPPITTHLAVSTGAGSAAGCVTVPLYTGKPYDVTVYAEAEVNGYSILVEEWNFPYTSGGASISETIATGLVASPSTYTHIIPTGASGWAEVLFSGFLFARLGPGGAGSWPGNEVYYIVGGVVLADEYQTHIQSSGLLPPHIQATNVNVNNAASKFDMAHLTGHWIQGMNDEQTPPWSDASGELADCDGSVASTDPHDKIFTRQYHSRAGVEGFAHYMVAFAFNNPNESDCTIQRHHPHYGSVFFTYDVDLDGLYTEMLLSLNEFSCEGKPWDLNHNGVADTNPWEPTPILPWVSARDWLEDAVNSDPDCGSTSLVGVSSEYDWLRYFWDMRTDENFTNAEMVELVDRADFKDWHDFGSLVDRPFYRMYIAAWEMGETSSHTSQWDNGLDRW